MRGAALIALFLPVALQAAEPVVPSPKPPSPKSSTAPAAPAAPRWSIATEKDGIGKIASIKGGNAGEFLILRCDKAAKATLILGLPMVRTDQTRAVRFTGADTGDYLDGTLDYVSDAKAWRMTASAPLVGLLAGKDTKLKISSGGMSIIELSLAGSTKAIGETMTRCAAPPAAPTEESVRAAVNDGYKGFYRQMGEIPDVPDAFVFSAETDKLFAKAQESDPSFPGADPFCRCQDYSETQFRYEIGSITLTGNRAQVTVYVAPFGGPLTGDPVVLQMLLSPMGKWVVDDVDGLKDEAKSYAP